MPTGGGGTRPADAGQATASCSDGQPPAPAVSAVRTPTVQTPALWTPTAVPGAADSQGVGGVRFHRHPDTGRSVRQRQDGCGPAAAVAAPRRDRAGRICSSVLLNWPGRRSQRRTAVRMPGHRTRPGEHREPARPGTADTRDRRRAWGPRGSGHAGQPAAGPSTTRQPCPTGTGPNVGYRPARPADRQIRSLMLSVGLVGSRRIWPAHLGCLVGPDGSRRIQSDRLDDQTDDQAAGRRVLGHPDHGDRWWSGHQIFHLVTPDGTATRAQPGPPPRRARSRPGRPDDPRPRPGGHQGRVRREHRAGTSSRPTSRRATGSSRSTPPTPRWRRPGTSWTPRSCTGPAARAVDLGRGVHLHHRERLRSVGRGRRRLGVPLRPGDVPAGLPRAAAAGNR
jgi:hypothetical protein